MLDKLDKFHKTRAGYTVFTLIEAGLTYLMVGLAIDRGSWWWYLLTLIFLVGCLQNLWHLVRPPKAPVRPKGKRL